MTQIKKGEPIPHHVVTEFIGQLELSGTDERQIYVSEQLASISYSSMEDLINTSQSFVKNRARFNAMVEKLKTHTFFKPYFEAK